MNKGGDVMSDCQNNSSCPSNTATVSTTSTLQINTDDIKTVTQNNIQKHGCAAKEHYLVPGIFAPSFICILLPCSTRMHVHTSSAWAASVTLFC